MNQSAATIDAWKEHVTQCGLCKNAKGLAELCPIGQNFWRPAEILSRQEPAPVSPPVQSQPQSQPQVHNALTHETVASLGNLVASRVVARSASGAAIAVPMEKTSKAVGFSTAPGVQMYMPERDIEIYSEMRDMMPRLLRIAQIISHAATISSETRHVVRSKVESASENEVALVIRHARGQFGLGDDFAIYNEFHDMTRRVLRMGDRLGNFMRVDERTHEIIRACRMLAMDMQGELDRSLSEQLRLDEKTRELAKPLRMLAIDFQGEIERRVGTP